MVIRIFPVILTESFLFILLRWLALTLHFHCHFALHNNDFQFNHVRMNENFEASQLLRIDQ